MVGRDEWFTIHTSAPPERSLEKGADATPSGTNSFRVDPEAAPAMKAGFERAMQQMMLAQKTALQMNYLRDLSVNPVVDKYMAAMVDRATGDEGSVTVAADSAIAEYQSVIDQLDRVMAGYQGTDNAVAHPFGQQP